MTKLAVTSRLALALAAFLCLGGCLARAAVGVAGTVAGAAVDVTGAAVDVVTPGDDDDDDDDD